MTVAIALSQIGEFSFILATLGRDLGLLNNISGNALVATAMISIVLNPLAYRAIGPIEQWLRQRPRLWRWLDRDRQTLETNFAPPAHRPADPGHRAVVIGFGPTGRSVVRLLRENGVSPSVIELNIDAVRQMQDDGIDAVYGDATRLDTLKTAGIARAGTLILGSAGMANSAEVVRLARGENPAIRVLARADYLRDLESLRRAGADSIYSGEGEVALAFIEDILGHLGATADQIDRERARAHRELVA